MGDEPKGPYAILDKVVGKYVEHLERGAATHAAYGKVASEQAVELSERSARRNSYEDAVLAELANVQTSIHTLGLTVALSALAQLGAQGIEVPDPPDVTPLEDKP